MLTTVVHIDSKSEDDSRASKASSDRIRSNHVSSRDPISLRTPSPKLLRVRMKIMKMSVRQVQRCKHPSTPNQLLGHT